MRDLKGLSEALGKNLGAFLEYTDEQSEVSTISLACPECSKVGFLKVPTKQVKEQFRKDLIEALPRGQSNLAPSLKHFWFCARCSVCNRDVSHMRS